MAELLFEEKLPQALQALCERLNKYVQKKQEEKNIAEEQAKSPIAITPVLPTIEPEDSLSMRDEHLSTILEKEPDKVIKSSVENLVPIPSESKDLTDYESECDMPVCDDSSSKNEGLEDIVSIPPEKEIDHLDAIPNSVQSLLNRATSIIFLIKEFTSKLAPIDPIPPGVVEAYLDPEEDIRLIEKLLNDDSSPHSPEELNSEIPDAIIESFSPSPIPVEDNDSLMEDIDIFLAPDDLIPPGFENDDYDSEGDVLFLAELLNNDYISLPEYESFHVEFYNVPSSTCPPEKPPDDDIYFDIEPFFHKPDTGVLTTKVVDDISDNSTSELYVHVPNVLPTLPTLYLVFDTLLPFSSENEDKVFNPGILISNEEKSPHLLSHRGFKVFQLINDSESPMMIYGGDIPILDVPYLHFYPP
ncbi:hypothetical protein Tco_0773043 [Tanacetum coccineum]|uniref:Reverse transcriptase domain-containing protein n=1 Tax=Tanacetum coccineum TaxID=301880 RepID=A0ABQ4ZKM1_9ASTR